MKHHIQFNITLLLFFSVFSSFGATITWNGSGSDQKWNTATNWIGGIIPGNSDDVIVPAGSNVIVDATPSSAVNSLFVQGTLTINSSVSLSVTQSTATTAYVFQIGGGIVSNNGTITVTGMVGTNPGLSFVSGTATNGLLTNTGTLTVNTSAGTGACVNFNQTTGGIATLNMGSSGVTLTQSSAKTVFNVAAGTAQIGGALTFGSSSSYVNCKFINVSAGNLTLLPSANINAYVTFSSSNNSLSAAAGTTTTLTNNGTLAIHLPTTGAGSSVFLLSPSTASATTILSNAGTITIDGANSTGSVGSFGFQGSDATSIAILNNTGTITDTHTGTTASIYSFSATTGNRIHTINNSGTMSLSTGMTLGSVATINNNSGGILNVKGTISGNTFNSLNSTINNNVGAIFNCDVSTNTTAALSGTMAFNNYGTLTGRGSMASTVTFNPRAGIISPGNSTTAYGQFNISGTSLDFSNSTFVIKVNGTSAGTNFDQVINTTASAITMTGVNFILTKQAGYSAAVIAFNASNASATINVMPTASGDNGFILTKSAGAITATWTSGQPAKAPSIITIAPSSITTTNATFNANLINTGGDATNFDRGFCYKTSAGVTLTDNKTSESNTSTTAVFSKLISSLLPNTQYFYKGYATNSVGTTLSSTEISFFTLANVPAAPVLSANASSINVTVSNSDGNPTSTLYAIMSNGQYVLADGTLGFNPVWQTAASWGTKTVTGLSGNTLYNFQVKALNGASVETAFGTSTSLSTLVLPIVTALVGTYTYNGSPQGPTSATNTGTGTSYTFTYASQDGTTYLASSTLPTAAGNYTVTATVLANGIYGSASSDATAFTILPEFFPIGQQSDCSTTGLTIAYKTDPTVAYSSPTATRTICQLPGFCESNPAVQVNMYGSRTDKQTTATGYYYVKQINGRWWVVDPLGYLNISKGAACLGTQWGAVSTAAYSSLYGNSIVNWMNSTKQMLKDNGFYAAGCWSDITNIKNNPNQSTKPLAYTVYLNLMAGYGAKIGKSTLDVSATAIPVFESGFATYCDSVCKNLVSNIPDQNLFGYFTDNELPFFTYNLSAFLALGNTSRTDPNYVATINWLTANGYTTANASSTVVQNKFLAYVASTYYSTVYNAIKRYDPVHMVIGSRVCQTATRAIPDFMTAAGPYVDIFSVNYYSAWTPSVTLSQSWGTQLGKPYIVSEFYTKGDDVGFSNVGGAGFIVKNQSARGYEYQNFTLSLLESKTCVGWHWFKYMDNDSTISADSSNLYSNKGIVNLAYVPYTAMTDLMKAVNLKVYNLTDYFDSLPVTVPVTASYLTDLFIQNYRLSTFNPDTLTYKIALPATTTANPSISYTKSNTAMTVVLTNPRNVFSTLVSDRTATLYSTSADRLQHRTYTIIFDKVSQITTGLNTITELNGISCYPNPVDRNKVLTIQNQAAGSKDNFLQVTDLSGKVVIKTIFSGSEYQLKLQGTVPGIYLLEINNSKGQFRQKLMVR